MDEGSTVFEVKTEVDVKNSPSSSHSTVSEFLDIKDANATLKSFLEQMGPTELLETNQCQDFPLRDVKEKVFQNHFSCL